MDELGVKLTGPVSPSNLDSGKSNVPGYTTETHGPLLSSSILIFFHRNLYQSEPDSASSVIFR